MRSLFLFLILAVDQLLANGSCNCLQRQNLDEPLIIRSFCFDDFAWKVFVRSDKSDIEFKDSKNITFNRYDVRIAKVYKDSKNTTVFSEGFVYTPEECTINLVKSRFVIVFGFYDKTDGKPVVNECTFHKIIDDLNVGERLFLMSTYRRFDCLDRYVREPSAGAPGMPGRPASMGFGGKPFIPGLPGIGGLGGHGGLPGVGQHGIFGGHGGTGGNGGTAFGSGMGGHGGDGGTGGPGSRSANKLEYTKDLESLHLKEVPKRGNNGIVDEMEKRAKREIEVSSEATEGFGAPALITAKPSLILNTIPSKDSRLKDESRVRWPLRQPQSNSWGQQGWAHESTESTGMSEDFNLCSIASFQDLPQCTSDDWEQEDRPTKPPNRQRKGRPSRPPSRPVEEERPIRQKPRPRPEFNPQREERPVAGPQREEEWQQWNPPTRRPEKRPQQRPSEWEEEQYWEERRPQRQKDSFSCSCLRMRQLEESCSATFAQTMTKFFE